MKFFPDKVPKLLMLPLILVILVEEIKTSTTPGKGFGTSVRKQLGLYRTAEELTKAPKLK